VSGGNCGPIAEKFESTRETSAATAATFAEMSVNAEATCVNFARTNVRARHKLSYEQIGRRSKAIARTSAAIAVIFMETIVIDVAMFATSGRTGEKRGGINEHGDVARP